MTLTPEPPMADRPKSWHRGRRDAPILRAL